MTELEETLVYDALASIQENSAALCELAKNDDSRASIKAYQNGVYAPAIKLQAALGEEAVQRGKTRHERISKQCEEFFKL